MKTYVNRFYGRNIPIKNVAIKFCFFSKHALEGNEIKEYIYISIDRKINNIKHECFTKNENLRSYLLRKIHPNQKRRH